MVDRRHAPAALPPGKYLVPIVEDTTTRNILKLMEPLKQRMPVEEWHFKRMPQKPSKKICNTFNSFV